MSVDQATLIAEKQQSISTVLTTKLLGTFSFQEKWVDFWPQGHLGENTAGEKSPISVSLR